MEAVTESCLLSLDPRRSAAVVITAKCNRQCPQYVHSPPRWAIAAVDYRGWFVLALAAAGRKTRTSMMPVASALGIGRLC